MRTRISGLWLPIVTPFRDGAVDFASYERLVEHYLQKGITGLCPLGTTGEAPTLEDDEVDRLVELTVALVGGRVPVFVGVGGNSTQKVERTLRRLHRFRFEGIVSVCPYYNRPTQDGLVAHFRKIAASTDREVMVYNIPYRTAVNLENETLLELAEIPNLVGVKESSGSIAQSLDLLARRPDGFAVMTGEDALYFTMLAHGGDGGILAASHVATDQFVEVGARMAANDVVGARAVWSRLAPSVSLLFAEPNPMPIKYVLWKQGLIASPECRLPLAKVSEGLRARLETSFNQPPLNGR